MIIPILLFLALACFLLGAAGWESGRLVSLGLLFVVLATLIGDGITLKVGS